MKIRETIQPSINRQRVQLAESLRQSGVDDVVMETHMAIFEADRAVWQESSYEDIMADLDLADSEDAN